jgi:hypothetical protein
MMTEGGRGECGEHVIYMLLPLNTYQLWSRYRGFRVGGDGEMLRVLLSRYLANARRPPTEFGPDAATFSRALAARRH